jgi:hypothetical protein
MRWGRTAGATFTVLFGLLAPASGRADAPPLPPGTPQHSCSLNGRWCLELQANPPAVDARTLVRVVERGQAGGGHERWSRSIRILGWPAITNDGRCIVDFATKGDSLAMDETSDTTAFAIYCQDGGERAFRVGQFIADFAALPLSTSHRVWASRLGVDAKGHVTLRTPEGRNFVIDPRTGQLLEGALIR